MIELQVFTGVAFSFLQQRANNTYYKLISFTNKDILLKKPVYTNQVVEFIVVINSNQATGIPQKQTWLIKTVSWKINSVSISFN